MVDASWNKRRAKWPAFGQAHNKCRNEQLKRYIAAIQRVSDGQRARRGKGLVMESQPALRAVTAKVQIRRPKRRQPTTRRWVPCGPRTRRYRGRPAGGRELGTGSRAAGWSSPRADHVQDSIMRVLAARKPHAESTTCQDWRRAGPGE